MSRFRRICTVYLILFSFFSGADGIAQLAIGQWRDHLSYKKGIALAQSQDHIYCASESGIFSLNKNDNSIERMSKITGLSDVGVNAVNYNAGQNTLVIAYKNANIDLVQGNSIYNISDIKRSIINGKKIINNIHFRGNLAYLSCGFGIVVLDLSRKEIKETYYIGVNGGFINVRDLTSDASNIYAATDSGVYTASLTAGNLSDFNSWNKFPGLPQGVYNTIASFNGNVYVNLSAPSGLPWPSDTIYKFDGTQWTDFLKADTSFNPVHRIEASQGKLLVSNVWGTDVFDQNDSALIRLFYFTTGYSMNAYNSIVDLDNSDTYWIADNNNGLIKSYFPSSGLGAGSESYAPNGPNTSNVYAMNVVDEDLWVAPGDRGETWSNVYNKAEAYYFSEENWYGVFGGQAPSLDSLYDVVAIAVDPADNSHVYLSALGGGVIEMKNGSQINFFNDKNSSLQSTGWSTTYHWVGVFDMKYDKDGNLWFSNSTAPQPLVVLDAGGNWHSFNLSSLVTNPTTGNILIDQNNQKWMVLPRGVGLLVFDENGTFTTTGDDKMVKLYNGVGNGNLQSNEVYCIAEDKDGEIWVGTNKGISVFYCPDQVLTSSGCEAQPIYVEQDGHTQILLETESVNAIAIDGGNRKWIGTQNSGVFLMSADGTDQIKHFTVDNSPLLSNEVRSIAIHPKTGEVFFGTADGIISYRNDATTGLEEYTDVYVFPNPVRPGYEGPIAITGLIENAQVKVTDISGGLVYSTQALGGQAIWYGRNFNGERCSSGVYLVYCTNDDGSKTFVTKIMLVN